MRILPILFNTDMVRALLDGRKTVTRRVVKFKPGQNRQWTGYTPDGPVLYGSNNIPAAKSPYHPGDILYVRETFFRDNAGGYHYRADDDVIFFERDIGHGIGWTFPKWHPSIHMPKEAARLFLRVTGVRVERLRDITPDGIAAEGVGSECTFIYLWDDTIKTADRDRYGWAANPWVWVIEFERISKEAAVKGREE